MIVESLKNSGLLTDSATETVKHEIEKHGGFLGAMKALMGYIFGFYIDKCHN